MSAKLFRALITAAGLLVLAWVIRLEIEGGDLTAPSIPLPDLTGFIGLAIGIVVVYYIFLLFSPAAMKRHKERAAERNPKLWISAVLVATVGGYALEHGLAALISMFISGGQ
ncbi:hypothetical protein [Glycomyces xiaoerkulensis]|uniref:hypothetical protein n=1 Tax=Glycomyces xiaoerkulensis TaxID=2038139 RepID=UPI000C263D45|nr:hypothetical protein [Glycomyces xiaoerkulensis]